MKRPPQQQRIRRALEAGAARPPCAEHEFRIQLELGGSYVGVDSAGRGTFLVPLEAAPPSGGRAGGALEFVGFPNVRFHLDEDTWERPAAVVRCTSKELLDVFSALVSDLSHSLRELGHTPRWQDVSTSLSRWEHLLRQRQALSASEELGLWGELWFLLSASDLDAAALSWRGPSDAPVDFVHSEIGIEVKTSFKRLQHDVSQSQVDRPIGDLACYLLSIWVEVDPGAGHSLPDLVDRVRARLADPIEFERRLAKANYSDDHRLNYSSRFVVVEPPCWIPAAMIPRVREADPGVTQLRYRVTIDGDLPLATSERVVLEDRLLPWRKPVEAGASA